MQPDSRKHLFDAQQAAAGIVMFSENRTIEDYKSDLMLRLAIERQFEIIGEALGRLRKSDPLVFQQISEADRIVGFRNVIIHGYDSLNDETTWRIVQDKLPILRTELETLLK